MKTNVLTPQEVFYLPQRLVVPLFQRPFVWDEVDQWLPLWQDVTRMAELRLRDPSTAARHFLGAIVLQASGPVTGTVPSSNVIDGQQRLTTLQLLVDATAAVLEERGVDHLSQQLGDLTHNRTYLETGPALKLRHTNRDREAFEEVMGAEPPVEHEQLRHAGSLITRAHQFFSGVVTQWLESDQEGTYQLRADALMWVLTQGLQLVVIDLQPQENSQEIFETLNARGTPLTAADLIKNFVFQRLKVEGVDTRRAYAEDWPFDREFWEIEVSVGRHLMSRGSLFLSQWLAARVGEELSPRQVFSRFKHYVDYETSMSMADLLAVIKAQADQYEAWTRAASDSGRDLTVTERAFYRMQASEIELLKPALLWLHDPELKLPQLVIDDVVVMLESWVVRRQLLRLPSGDLGRVLADIIRSHRDAKTDDLVDRVRSNLTRFNAPSTYWPGNEELRNHLRTEQAYRRYRRPRLRVYLEAIEDHLRGAHKYPTTPRKAWPIEHVLPQKWETNWPVDGLEAELNRSEHVHRIGNLTLLSESLNATVSNRPWLGEKGKRARILKHDVFLINRPFQDKDVWDEASIDARSDDMIDALITTWPVPDGHVGHLADATPREQGWVEVKHLVVAGLLSPGTVLRPSGNTWRDARAFITDDGKIEMDGQIHLTPSGAGHHLRGRATNGWTFWRLEDGRRLADVRAEFRGERPGREQERFDWSRLHQILEMLPEGNWTSYSELADAVGTAPKPLGGHVTTCRQCANAWRILTADGRVADTFTWTDPDDTRDPTDLLTEEGVTFVNGRADSERKLTSDDLDALVQSVAS